MTKDQSAPKEVASEGKTVTKLGSNQAKESTTKTSQIEREKAKSK